MGRIRIRTKRSRIWNNNAKIPLSYLNVPIIGCDLEIVNDYALSAETCILVTFSHYLAEDTCRAEDEGTEATITAEDLDISSVQLTGPGGSSCSSSAEKPAPKNIFYFYQVAPVLRIRIRDPMPL